MTQENLTIGIASDHGGFKLKDTVKEYLKESGYEILDLGCKTEDSVDYPDYAKKLADELREGNVNLGVLICGTGIGISISANKITGIRAALCHDVFSAEMARKHNDANVLALGARVIGVGHAVKIVDTFLQHEFEGGRHIRRVNKISQMEC